MAAASARQHAKPNCFEEKACYLWLFITKEWRLPGSFRIGKRRKWAVFWAELGKAKSGNPQIADYLESWVYMAIVVALAGCLDGLGTWLG